jgi:UDP-GlcNAc:undecaprenyl-phosphate GlcNAc-1-phosphate transferase
MIRYLIPFLIAFFITVVSIIGGIFLGKRIEWEKRKESRHIHPTRSLRVGGVAMIIAFNLAIFLNQELVMTVPLFGFLLATWIILLVGIWDDLKELFWKTQFFYQIAVAVLVFIFGVRIYYISNFWTGGIINFDSGIWVLLAVGLVLFWIILMINSMNWIDGIDGVSGGITFIGAITMFFLSLKPEVNQPPMAIMAMILAGTSMGFLIFNFNPSFVLAGTAGSMFMGFSLAVMAIFAGTKIATAALVMAIPVIDFIWVIGERIRNGRSIFKPDKNHLHHKLLELGWSQWKTAIYFYIITIGISIIALNTKALGKMYAVIGISVIMLFALNLVNKKVLSKNKLKEEKN